MKKSNIHFIVAASIYAGTFIVLIIIAWINGLVYFDFGEILEPEVGNFMLTVLLAFAASLAVYSGFFLFQRYKANTEPKLKYLKLSHLIPGSLLASIAGFAVIAISVYLTDNAGEVSLFLADTTMTGIALGADVIASIVSFIFLKPRA
jgi:hypothetical protein